jgi:hypothetical protein
MGAPGVYSSARWKPFVDRTGLAADPDERGDQRPPALRLGSGADLALVAGRWTALAVAAALRTGSAAEDLLLWPEETRLRGFTTNVHEPLSCRYRHREYLVLKRSIKTIA